MADDGYKVDMSKAQSISPKDESHRLYKRPGKETCPIIGIGASAGGLEAFKSLLENLPADTGMAFMFIQHMDPKHESMLKDILSRSTLMPVSEVMDNTVVEPDHVYVIQPGTELSASKEVISLELRENSARERMPIDTFFKSLVKCQGSRAVGVILSGTAFDGVQGLRDIKEAGGITFAQTPDSSKFDGMPLNAIVAGAVDFILSPKEIAINQAGISRFIVLSDRSIENEELFSNRAGELNEIFTLLRTASGINFADYKELTVKRRIVRRMVLHKIESLDGYVRFLLQNPEEITALYQEILISVTSFFRDPEVFENIIAQVFPDLFKDRPEYEPFRVWVPGCSTGEEAYSIAICVMEYLGDRAINMNIQIFATDVNEAVINKARMGIYPKSIEAAVSPERLKRFFVEMANGYQINKMVRDRCVFARHDMTKDPPFSRLDLISCRNVIIYLGRVLQKKIFPIFHFALKQKGVLLLGRSESVGEFADLFELIDKTNKVYKRKTAATPLIFKPYSSKYAAASLEPLEENAVRNLNSLIVPDIQMAADQVVLNRYAPAGVIINSDLQIIRFRGRTGAYLEPASGTPSLNILTMARDGLMLGLSKAINRAKKEAVPAREEGLRVFCNSGVISVNIEVVPIDFPHYKGRYYLVLFEEAPAGCGRQKGLPR